VRRPVARNLHVGERDSPLPKSRGIG